MYAATHDAVADADIFIAAAAVADYRPADVVQQKIKKNDATMTLALTRCPDILASVAALDAAPFTMGFAAETENLIDYARGKLLNKKLDMIVANLVGRGRGFDRDDNAATVLWNGGEKSYPTASKVDLARQLIELAAELFHASRCSKTQPRLSNNSNID
jgi:phosphopantothenoylcysteine decarboxylase/phosphopantothenate--cysteine ligase